MQYRREQNVEMRDCIAEQVQYVIKCRRYLHTIPEAAFCEHKTSRFILSELEKLKPDDLSRYADTGVRAVFSGTKGNPVAIRADMDALPVEEETGLPFQSEHSGYMHACGHDGHMAIALACARIVAGVSRDARRTYVFIFQPAEETTGGADPMIREGVLLDPDVRAIYGLHLWPYIEQGAIGLRPGPLMAAMSDVNIRITGSSCHGARPQDGADTIVAAAHFVAAAQSVISRNIDPYDAAVLTIGRIEGGHARNVIAGETRLEGTLRSFDENVHRRLRARLADQLQGLSAMFHVETSVEETMAYPAVCNDPALYKSALQHLSGRRIVEPAPVMISEDFSFYQQAVPGLFAFLGTGSPEHDEPLHSARFTFDEGVLPAGVEYYLRVTGFE